MKIILFILSFTLIFSCNGEEKKTIKNIKGSTTINQNNKMREKFDFEMYEKTHYGLEPYILENGTSIDMAFSKNKGGFQNEKLPKPSFETIYKEFNKEGFITKKEHYIGKSLKVGISEDYDDAGNVNKIDEDKKFGKIKPIDALRFLEEKGILNLKTGKAKQTSSGFDNFELSFDVADGKKQFIIKILEGKPYNGPYGIGEPPAASPIYYYMDGDTGEIISEK